MRTMIRNASTLLLLAAAIGGVRPAAAASFVYRGALSDRGAPAEGAYGFRLTFYDAQSGGNALAPATTLDGIAVSRGAFSASLELDPSLRARDTLWVQVEVRDASGVFVPMADREAVQPKAATTGVCWDTTGNAGNVVGTNFLGNADNVPLELRSNNAPLLRLQSAASGSGNVLGGSQYNLAPAAGTGVGVTVAGGGSITLPNKLGGNYSTIGGGEGNEAGNRGNIDPTFSPYATVAGGKGNIASAQYGSVGGGFGNTASVYSSTVAGGYGNAAGFYATVGGGENNTATGKYATVPGGAANVAGGFASFAAGASAVTRDATQAGTSLGDQGTFVWSDTSGGGFTSSGNNQFLVRALGGVGFNTSDVGAATVSIAASNPVLRLFNPTADSALGGRVLISENSSSDAGGYLDYDASANLFTIGTNNGSADSDTLILPRGAGRVGVGRTPALNALEVEGNASKTTATAWLANSDARIKQQIAPVEHALDTLLRIHPVTFRYADDYRAAHPSIEDRRYYNVIAQEFAEVFPDAVRSSRETLPGAKAAPANEILQVDIHPALITTIAAVQELAIENQRLREGLAALGARLDSIERAAARTTER